MSNLNRTGMTLLYPIPLLALGSVDVESFPSFLHRTAYEHNVNIGTLVQFVCKFSSAKANRFYAPQYIRPNELVRPHKTTKRIVSAFEAATGQKLSGSVFQFFDEAIGVSPNEVVINFKWCPECFREMKALNQKTYFKLIWHLSEIRYCPTHRTLD